MAEIDNNKTTTYGSSDINKTETYGNSENQKTTAYNTNQEVTAAYHDLQNKEFKSKTHGIGVGDKLTLRDAKYTITGIISEGTGEAVIYKVENGSKQTFALKLYFEFSNSKEEPNFETLKRIKDITDPDILKLYDFGVGGDKFQGKYCYEISDFAEGGDLFAVANFKEKYTKDFIEKIIVPEILNGIRKLHEFKIYHCDLKPSNIFFKDRNQTDLLIGDYGSAKAYDLETIKEIRKTSTVKGTETYLAPEQPRGIISEKNDYYSFGIILLHLLYPEQFSSENNIRQVDKGKFEKIVERQYNSQQVVDFNQSYKRLNNLIEGLTLINHINRFGKNEVEKWLNGEEVVVKYKATDTDSVQPVKLGYATIKTDKDFIEILETKSTWWEDLFEDVDTYFALKAWIGSYQDVSSRKIFDEMIHYYKPLGKEYVKESAIRYFDPEREIRIDMHSFNFFTTENVIDEVERYISKLDEIWKITSFEKVRFYLFLIEFSLKQLTLTTEGQGLILVNSIIEKFSSVFGCIPESFDSLKTQIQDKFSVKNQKESDYKLINLFYCFNLERSYKDLKNNEITSLQDIALSYLRDKNLYDHPLISIERKLFLEKNNKSDLIGLQYKDFIFSLLNDKTNYSFEFNSLVWINEFNYKINYQYSISLTNFMQKSGIQADSLVSMIKTDYIEFKMKLIPSKKTILRSFINELKKKHNIKSKLIINGTNIYDQEEIRGSHRNTHRIDSLNVENINQFKDQLFKSYNNVFKTKKLLFFSIISFIIGIGAYFIVQSQLNQYYKISNELNLFLSFPNFGITGIIFSLVIYILLFGKFRLRLAISLIVVLALISTVVINIYQNVYIVNRSKQHQHDFFIKSFKPIVLSNIRRITANEIHNRFQMNYPKSYTGNGTVYNSTLNYGVKRKKFNLTTEIPVVKAEFYDPGWFSSTRGKYTQVSNNPITNHLNIGLLNLDSLIDRAPFSIYCRFTDSIENQIYGIYVGNITVLLETRSLYVYKETDIKTYQEKYADRFSKEVWYYAIIGKDINKEYTTERDVTIWEGDAKNRNFTRGDSRPYAVSNLLYPTSKIISKQISVKNSHDLIINISGSNVQIVLDGLDSLNIEQNIDNYNLGLSFGFNSSFSIDGISINKIQDNRYSNIPTIEMSTINKEPKPYIISTDRKIKLYENSNLKNFIISQEKEELEVLYPEKDLMRVRSVLNNKLYYLKVENLNNIILK